MRYPEYQVHRDQKGNDGLQEPGSRGTGTCFMDVKSRSGKMKRVLEIGNATM